MHFHPSKNKKEVIFKRYESETVWMFLWLLFKKIWLETMLTEIVLIIVHTSEVGIEV